MSAKRCISANRIGEQTRGCLLAVPIGRERDISLRFDCSEPLGKGVRDGIVRGAAQGKAKCRLCTTSGGNQSIDCAPSVALDDKLPSAIARRTAPAGVFL